MLYSLGKKFFKVLINVIHSVRVFLVFWCFFIILYWILQIANVAFIQNFAVFFEPIKDFIHIFYDKGTAVGLLNVDFSFLYAVFLILLFAWSLKYFAEFIENTGKKYEEIHDFFKEKTEAVLNFQLDVERKLLESQKKNFFILVAFYTKNLKKNSFFEKNTDEKCTEKEQLIVKLFCSTLSQSVNFRQTTINNNILMYFNDFNNIDTVLVEFEKTFEKLKSDFKEQDWTIEFAASAEPCLHQNEIKEKINFMEKLIKLEIKNEILCLSSFKQRYLIIAKPKYEFSCKGIYDIDGQQEVFCLVNKCKNKRF